MENNIARRSKPSSNSLEQLGVANGKIRDSPRRRDPCLKIRDRDSRIFENPSPRPCAEKIRARDLIIVCYSHYNILGDPGAVSRDETRIGTGVKFSSKARRAPGSPRMSLQQSPAKTDRAVDRATTFPGSLFSSSLSRWNRDPGCGWSRDHPESGW